MMEDCKQLLDAIERVFWAREVREQYQAAWHETHDPDLTEYQTAEEEALADFAQALTTIIDRRVEATLHSRDTGACIPQETPSK
jgi:hypothetical protein